MEQTQLLSIKIRFKTTFIHSSIGGPTRAYNMNVWAYPPESWNRMDNKLIAMHYTNHGKNKNPFNKALPT